MADRAASSADAGTPGPGAAAAPSPVSSPVPSQVAPPRGASPRGAEGVFGALDLGTNNCRLLIAKARPEGGFQVIDAFSRIVRLGEGMTRTHRLSDAAMQRALAALRVCSIKLRRRGATSVRAVATEACRRALNSRDFIARVRRETGIRVEVISAAEEARLALAGCAPLLDARQPRALVFDIGGGSTELMWLDTGAPSGLPRLIDQVSLPKGVVTLAESYGGESVSAETYRAMVEDVLAAITPFERRNGIAAAAAAGQVQLLGTSGTVTTLAGIHMGLRRYERALVDGSDLDVAEARAVIARLLSMDLAGRAAEPCVGPERADLVLAGCAVFQAMVELWPIMRLRIADRGLREGMLMELMAAGRA